MPDEFIEYSKSQTNSNNGYIPTQDLYLNPDTIGPDEVEEYVLASSKVVMVIGGPGSGKVSHCETFCKTHTGFYHINVIDVLLAYMSKTGS